MIQGHNLSEVTMLVRVRSSLCLHCLSLMLASSKVLLLFLLFLLLAGQGSILVGFPCLLLSCVLLVVLPHHLCVPSFLPFRLLLIELNQEDRHQFLPEMRLELRLASMPIPSGRWMTPDSEALPELVEVQVRWVISKALQVLLIVSEVRCVRWAEVR